MTRRPVRVTVAATAADLIAKRACKAAPNETGGLLLGWWEGTAVVVAHAVEVQDPDATSSRWTRHENTAQAALDAALPDPTHPWLGYVGDWHSHPAPVDPSTTDELSLRYASRQYPQQKINKEQVEYAAKKIASVRRLTRTSAPIPHAGGVYEPRPLPRILGGVLTLDSDWSPLFGDPLRQALTARNEDEPLDLGCVLRHGGFEAPNPSQPGSLAATGKETAVIFFTLRLLKRLQAMATVPAINYDAYAATVWP
jgi:integrative and conjugative element protein (TIGR02256 family)